MVDTSAMVRELVLDDGSFRYYSLPAAAENPALTGLARLPFSLRVIAENLLRRRDDSDAIVFWGEDRIRRRLSHRNLYHLVSRLAPGSSGSGATTSVSPFYTCTTVPYWSNIHTLILSRSSAALVMPCASHRHNRTADNLTAVERGIGFVSLLQTGAQIGHCPAQFLHPEAGGRCTQLLLFILPRFTGRRKQSIWECFQYF